MGGNHACASQATMLASANGPTAQVSSTEGRVRDAEGEPGSCGERESAT